MKEGAAVLADEVNQAEKPDGILSTSLLDLVGFKQALSHARDVPVIHYFHESQFTYPTRNEKIKRANEVFTLKNLSSCLGANCAIFNSEFHRRTFFKHAKVLAESTGGTTSLPQLELSEKKSAVIPCGVEVKKIRKLTDSRTPNPIPVILWNHRWEHDKSPQQFFDLLCKVEMTGVDFRLVLLGEAPRHCPDLDRLNERFAGKVIVPGYRDSRQEYLEALVLGDLTLSCADHDFFGVSMVEAIAAGAFRFSRTDSLIPSMLEYGISIKTKKSFFKR